MYTFETAVEAEDSVDIEAPRRPDTEDDTVDATVVSVDTLRLVIFEVNGTTVCPR